MRRKYENTKNEKVKKIVEIYLDARIALVAVGAPGRTIHLAGPTPLQRHGHVVDLDVLVHRGIAVLRFVRFESKSKGDINLKINKTRSLIIPKKGHISKTICQKKISNFQQYLLGIDRDP